MAAKNPTDTVGTAERDADPLVNPVFNPACRRTGPDQGRNRSMECGIKKLRLSDSARHAKGASSQQNAPQRIPARRGFSNLFATASCTTDS
ncbi:hypothetical protein ACW7BC_28220 [Azospirillum argentinense]